ncbi:hypothetical protein C1I72_01145 [Ehrlichia canis]|nr:hypothetical protein C1I72_01145 [Ehrlichia canis]
MFDMCSTLDKCCLEVEQQCDTRRKLVILHSGLLFELQRICYSVCYQINNVVKNRVSRVLERVRNLVINNLDILNNDDEFFDVDEIP